MAGEKIEKKVDLGNIKDYIAKLRTMSKNFDVEIIGHYKIHKDANGNFLGSIWTKGKNKTSVTIQDGDVQRQALSNHLDGTVDMLCEYNKEGGEPFCKFKDGSEY